MAADKTFFGVNLKAGRGVDMSDVYAKQAVNYGRLPVVRDFNDGLPKEWSWYEAKYGILSSLVVSFKIHPSVVLDGEWDEFLLNWFQGAPEGRTTWWSYWHEPENDIAAGKFTAEEYRAAWLHLRHLSLAASWKNDNRKWLRSTQILMGWTLEKASGRDWLDYFPDTAETSGPGCIDVQGWDVYNHGGAPDAKHPGYVNPATMFYDIESVASTTGKRWGVAELGSLRIASDTEGTERGNWLESVGAYLLKPSVAYCTYYDVVGPKGSDYRLLDEPSQKAWAGVINRGA